MQKIIPFLWFEDQAEEAADFYTSVFMGAKILSSTRYDEAGARAAKRAAGSVMTVSFSIEDQEFLALNGGPQFKFSPAISFVVNCANQGEIDWYWNKLSEEGERLRCGWLKDKFGVTWQVVPSALARMLTDADTARARRVMQAILKMGKLDIAGIERAYAG